MSGIWARQYIASKEEVAKLVDDVHRLLFLTIICVIPYNIPSIACLFYPYTLTVSSCPQKVAGSWGI